MNAHESQKLLGASASPTGVAMPNVAREDSVPPNGTAQIAGLFDCQQGWLQTQSLPFTTISTKIKVLGVVVAAAVVAGSIALLVTRLQDEKKPHGTNPPMAPLMPAATCRDIDSLQASYLDSTIIGLFNTFTDTLVNASSAACPNSMSPEFIQNIYNVLQGQVRTISETTTSAIFAGQETEHWLRNQTSEFIQTCLNGLSNSTSGVMNVNTLNSAIRNWQVLYPNGMSFKSFTMGTVGCMVAVCKRVGYQIHILTNGPGKPLTASCFDLFSYATGALSSLRALLPSQWRILG